MVLAVRSTAKRFENQRPLSQAKSAWPLLLLLFIVYRSELHHCLLSESKRALRHGDCKTKPRQETLPLCRSFGGECSDRFTVSVHASVDLHLITSLHAQAADVNTYLPTLLSCASFMLDHNKSHAFRQATL